MYLGEKKIQESMAKRLAETEHFQVKDGHLRINEHFFSIEGEGILTGVPCYLVRFASCNLRCTFCDTKFSSWFDKEYEELHWQAVLHDIVKYPGWVSYTGGEPFWRQANELEAWMKLIKTVAALGRPQKVETSGTVDPPDTFPNGCLFYSIAPKTAGMGRGTFLDPGLLAHILEKHARPGWAHIKFVIGPKTADEDFRAVKDLLAEVPVLKHYPIIFQPEGLTESTAEYIERCCLLVEAIKADPEIMAIPNWRMMPQTHQIFWRNARRR